MPIGKVNIKCCQCGKTVSKNVGHVNRANKVKLKLYCNKKCAGIGRRTTIEDKKRVKKEYDINYRAANVDKIKKRAAEYFKKDYAANPEKYRKERQRKMKAHIEYCRQPEYKKKKKVYDRQHRAKIQYGDYGEAAIALFELASIVDNRQAKVDQQLFNKSQKRKRNGKNSQRQKLESCTVGINKPG